MPQRKQRKRATKTASKRNRRAVLEKELKAPIEEASVDAYGKSEQATGFSPIPDPSPKGLKWIEVYRQWAQGWR